MVKLGIVLIVLAVIALPISLGASLFGLITVASVAYTAAKVSPVFLIVGIVLVVVGINRRRSRRVA